MTRRRRRNFAQKFFLNIRIFRKNFEENVSVVRVVSRPAIRKLSTTSRRSSSLKAASPDLELSFIKRHQIIPCSHLFRRRCSLRASAITRSQSSSRTLLQRYSSASRLETRTRSHGGSIITKGFVNLEAQRLRTIERLGERRWLA